MEDNQAPESLLLSDEEVAAMQPDLTALEATAQPAQDPQVIDDVEAANLITEAENMEQYGDSPITAAGLAAADAATFSASSRILKKMGVVTQKDLQQYQAQNPGADIVGTVGGIVIPALLTGGTSAAAKAVSAPVGMAIKAGSATEKAVAAALAKSVAESSAKKLAKEVIKKSVAANMVAKGAGGAIEGAVFGAGNALREDALGTAELNAENLISNIGTGALMGGAVSAALPLGSAAIGATAKGGKTLVDKAAARWADPKQAALEYIGATPAQRAKMASHTSGQEIMDNLPKILVEDGKINATNSLQDVVGNLQSAQDSANSRISSVIDQIDSALEDGSTGAFQQAKDTFIPIAKQVNKDFVNHYQGKGPAFSGIVNRAKKIVNSLNVLAGQPEYVATQKLTNRVASLTDEVQKLKNVVRKENAAATRAANEAGLGRISKLENQLALAERELEETVLARTKRNTDRGVNWDAKSAADDAAENFLKNKVAKLRSGLETESGGFYAPADAKTFFNKIQEVVQNPNPMFKANITPYSEEAYRNFKVFLSKDGKSGYAIKPDGELISVFSTVKGRGERLVDDAVRNKGATKLDAFDIDGKLPTLYGKHMVEKSRLKFADEYAPKDWDYAKLGRPDVVQMELPAGAKALKRAATENEQRLAQLQAELNATTAQHADLLKDKKWAKKVGAAELRSLKQDFDELAKSFYDNMKPSEASKAAYAVRKMMNDALKGLARRISPEVARELEAATLKSHQLIEVLDIIGKRAEKNILHANAADIVLGVLGTGAMGPSGLLMVAGKKFLESDMKRKLVILTDIQKANQKVSAKIASSTADFFKAANTPSRLATTYSLLNSNLAVDRENKHKPKTELEAFNNVSKNLNNLMTNSDQLLERSIKASAPVSIAAPQTAAVVGEKLVTMVQFLHSKMPKTPYETTSIFSKPRPYVPSSIEIAKFNRYVQAVENPMSVFDELASGAITREHIEALKAVYPDMYTRLYNQIMDHAQKQDEGTISYQQRLKIGMLLDIPTDDSLLGKNILGLQQNFDPQLQSQEGAAVGAPSQEPMNRDADLQIAERTASANQGFESRRS